MASDEAPNPIIGYQIQEGFFTDILIRPSVVFVSSCSKFISSSFTKKLSVNDFDGVYSGGMEWVPFSDRIEVIVLYSKGHCLIDFVLTMFKTFGPDNHLIHNTVIYTLFLQESYET